MRGILKTPSITTLATDEPETVPIIALEIMEILPGPPLRDPAKERAKSTKKRVAPEPSRKAPKMIKRKI
jgi:hypothetical protein